jgi:hypothetical protein
VALRQQHSKVDTALAKAICMGRQPRAANQRPVTPSEKVLQLDDITLDAYRHSNNLAYPTMPLSVIHDMDNKVDGRRHRGDDEGMADVLSGKQGQCAEFDNCLSS